MKHLDARSEAARKAWRTRRAMEAARARHGGFAAVIEDHELLAFPLPWLLTLERMAEQGTLQIVETINPRRWVVRGPLAVCLAIIDAKENRR